MGSTLGFAKVDRGEDFNPIVNNSIWQVGTSELKFLSSKTIGPITFTGQDIGKMLSQIGEGKIMEALSSLRDAIDSFSSLKNMVSNSPFEQLNSIVDGFKSDLSHLTAGIPDEIITTAAGIVASNTTPTATATSQLLRRRQIHQS
jgi:hypothetical protein